MKYEIIEIINDGPSSYRIRISIDENNSQFLHLNYIPTQEEIENIIQNNINIGKL